MANWSDRKLEGLRREYDLEQLNESSLPGDPLLLFKAWMEVVLPPHVLYFSSRPFESQVSAWASPQSALVPDRQVPSA